MLKHYYYTMLYEATYPDCGIVAYKPLRIIKGFYDIESDTFRELKTNKVYLSANLNLPILGKDKDHQLDAKNEEILNTNVNEEKVFFAFPGESEDVFEEVEDTLGPEVLMYDAKEKEAAILDIYEREMRCYYFFSLFDSKTEENVFYLIDKFHHNDSYNVDISLEFIEAITSASIDDFGNSNEVISVEEFGGIDYCDDVSKLKKTMDSEQNNSPKETNFDFDPEQLEADIKSEVIGQDHVVKALVSMMYKNTRYQNHDGLKSNMLILGPSGCGKTEIIRSLSRHLNIPMTIFDATTASASGFVGNSVSQAIKDLVTICNGDIEKAENGIIVIDEIDKLATHGSESVNKGDVQDELFKMLEGDEITIAADNYREKTFRFNPKKVTFIGIGSAQALIDQKKNNLLKRQIGFVDTVEAKPEIETKEIELTPEDLIKFGLKPELLRRLNVIKVVKELKKEDLVNILSESKISNLKLYENAFKEVDKVSMVVKKELLEKIAEKASQQKAGASGLKRVVDDMLQTSVRKIRILNGKTGELVVTEETLDNPDNFELYEIHGKEKVLVYPQMKIKK